MDWFLSQSAPVQALLGTLFTWGMTALGAMMVFFFKKIEPWILNLMMGFASGVMIAASFWSLLAPAIEMAEGGSVPAWAVATIGFLAGAGFLWTADKILPHIHFTNNEAEGLPTKFRRSILLVLSITLHNIPEGLAVGVAFGAAASGGDAGLALGAVALALGIGIQNFPEGAAVSIPLRREGLSRSRSFFYGQLSGIVEPVAAVIGALFAASMSNILPYALCFAAGAMIFVVIEELIPQAKTGTHRDTHLSTLGCIFGFVVMMILDVAL